MERRSHLDEIFSHLRGMRAKRSLTAEKVAEAICEDKAVVLAWESRSLPPGDDLWDLADLYRCSIDELVGRQNRAKEGFRMVSSSDALDQNPELCRAVRPFTDREVAALPVVLGVRETSRLLLLSEYQVRALARSGSLPASRIGGRWRFSRDALLARVGIGMEGISAARRDGALDAKDGTSVRKRQSPPCSETGASFAVLLRLAEAALACMRQAETSDRADSSPRSAVTTQTSFSKALEDMASSAGKHGDRPQAPSHEAC